MRNVQVTMTVVMRNVLSHCFPLEVIVMIILTYTIHWNPTSGLKVYITNIIYYLCVICLYKYNVGKF